jgi:hypothetical protein
MQGQPWLLSLLERLQRLLTIKRSVILIGFEDASPGEVLVESLQTANRPIALVAFEDIRFRN